MSKPRKVAIIGAGPSALATAKILLHNFPQGTFSPIIFEKNHKVGGLWSVDCPAASDDRGAQHQPRGLVNPSMRTNLSRFSVAFSDLAWSSVFDGPEAPMFPQAWQVGRYLEAYAERYLTKDVLRLGRRVIRTSREETTGAGSGGSWNVQWISEAPHEQDDDSQSRSPQKVESERFDFLVVASGHFGTPYIPSLPGLSSFADKVFHSSELQNADDVRRVLEKTATTRGKLVVIGGSMSGAEAASALALHLSSLKFNPDVSGQDGNAFEVHHVCAKPFWVLPTYLPYRYSQEASEAHTMPFLPLDLVLYDLGRRPPGTVEFGFGPASSEQVSRINEYFLSMLGNDYGKISGVGIENTQPPWIAIRDDYAEYVRSGAVKITAGRARAVHYRQPGLARIDIETPDGHTSTLDDVAAIVMATGFTSTESLSFLPQDILSTLEFSENDHFLPLILDGKGSSHAKIPDLGFVGFYRGAFWGPMEMQAQSLAERWACIDTEQETVFTAEELDDRARERRKIRDFRNTPSSISRGQFPMGDYVGLMETFARELGKSRIPISGLAQKPGPVVPARYSATRSHLAQGEVDSTMAALRRALLPESGMPSTGTATAIFRALHGQWGFSRVAQRESYTAGQEDKVVGTVSFHPRYPSSAGYEKEYICEETVKDTGLMSRSIYRLCEDTSIPSNGAQIHIWSRDEAKSLSSEWKLVHQLKATLAQESTGNGKPDSGEYIAHAVDVHVSGSQECSYDYVFRFNGVAISSWECIVTFSNSVDGIKLRKTVYNRDILSVT